jgi:hypothetical protein
MSDFEFVLIVGLIYLAPHIPKALGILLGTTLLLIAAAMRFLG